MGWRIRVTININFGCHDNDFFTVGSCVFSYLFSLHNGTDHVLGGKVVSGLQQSLHLKPVRNSFLVYLHR